MSNVRLTGVRAVVFDLDDTLYLERSFALSGFAAVGAWLREHMACPCDPCARMAELFESEHRRRVFDRLMEEWGVRPAEPLVREMIDRFRTHQPRIRLCPDAERALTCWNGRFKLGLISDGPLAVQQNKVQALGLTSRLDQIILTDRWGEDFWKPHPRAFEWLEQSWGVRGQQLVYLADNPAKDFIAPRQRGWQTVRVRREQGIHSLLEAECGTEADHEVRTLEELMIC